MKWQLVLDATPSDAPSDDSLSDTVTKSILVHRAPTAGPDTDICVSAGGPTSINVLANDGAGANADGNRVDADGDVIFLPPSANPPAIVTAAANGTAAAADPNRITYTPAAGFSGTDAFAYQIRDEHGALSSPTDVTVDVQGSGQRLTAALTPTIIGLL